MGAFDYVKSVVEADGELDFWKVNMRPGKPLAFGKYHGHSFLRIAGKSCVGVCRLRSFCPPGSGEAFRADSPPASLTKSHFGRIGHVGWSRILLACYRDGRAWPLIGPSYWSPGFREPFIIGPGKRFTDCPLWGKIAACKLGSTDMADRIRTKPAYNTAPFLFWSTVGFAILGAADAVYLLIYKLTGNPHMCLGNGGCHNVNFSPYSEIRGLPVSVFGIAAYLAILCILVLETRVKIAKENGPLAIFGISLCGVAFTAYLTYLEIYVIHAICPFCVVSAIVITFIFILAIIRLVKQTAN